MSKFSRALYTSLCALPFTYLSADDSSAPPSLSPEIFSEFTSLSSLQEESMPQIITPPVASPKVQESFTVQKVDADVPFSPFTGKIKGKKVRLRLRPDLDSRIIKELSKNDLVSVVGEKGDFWAVEPPAHFKAYVFRSFVLDNVIEGNHVNVRLEPSLEAPIIGHFNAGDRIDPQIAAANNKWYEVSPPADCCFYIAKELIAFAGAPELKKQLDKRRETGEELFETTEMLAKSELLKPFDTIDFNRIVHSYSTVVNDFDEFPELVEQSSEALAHFQEAYLQKRITYLEKQSKEQASSDVAAASKKMGDTIKMITDRMKMWEPMEEALYMTWANCNEKKNHEQFYEDQKLAAEKITGIIDPYLCNAKGKPGDFLLRTGDVAVAYIYSTRVNLDSLVGKHATLLVAPRPNNYFALPAYYVLGVE